MCSAIREGDRRTGRQVRATQTISLLVLAALLVDPSWAQSGGHGGVGAGPGAIKRSNDKNATPETHPQPQRPHRQHQPPPPDSGP